MRDYINRMLAIVGGSFMKRIIHWDKGKGWRLGFHFQKSTHWSFKKGRNAVNFIIIALRQSPWHRDENLSVVISPGTELPDFISFARSGLSFSSFHSLCRACSVRQIHLRKTLLLILYWLSTEPHKISWFYRFLFAQYMHYHENKSSVAAVNTPLAFYARESNVVFRLCFGDRFRHDV